MESLQIIIGFSLTILIFIVVGGVISYRSSGSKEEYLLGGRSSGRFVVGLSAGASSASGFIMIGAVGAGYEQGIDAFLYPLSWLIGDYLFWTTCPQRIYKTAVKSNCFTIPELLSANVNDVSRFSLRKISALLIILIVGIYAGAQVIAAGKSITSIAEFDLAWGMLISLVIIVSYCAQAGLQASMINNFLQALMMLAVAVAIPVAAVSMAGGPTAMLDSIAAVDPALLQFSALDSGLSYVIIMVVGFIAAAFGFDLSTPQLLVRLLAGKDQATAKQAKWIFLGFLQTTWLCMSALGIMLHVFLPDLVDPEQGLILFASQNFSPWLVGIILAGVFSAIASTLDAQLLVISSALSYDLSPNLFRKLERKLGRATNLVVTSVVALFIFLFALNAPSNVYYMVILAVVIMGGAFAPAMVIIIFNMKTTASALKACICSGALAAVAWRAFGLNEIILESLPASIVAFLIHYLVVRKTSSNYPASENKLAET